MGKLKASWHLEQEENANFHSFYSTSYRKSSSKQSSRRKEEKTSKLGEGNSDHHFCRCHDQNPKNLYQKDPLSHDWIPQCLKVQNSHANVNRGLMS